MIKIYYTKKQKGFSLIEMMVVVVILGLIVLGLVTFFTGGVRSWVAGQSQLTAQRNARQAMDQMVREIRETDYIEPNSTSSSIYFHTPFDGSISYSLIIRDLKRGSNPIINNVQSLIFKYFDSTDTEIITFPITEADADKVSKVHIDLQVDVDQDSNPDITLSSYIDLRNFALQE